MNLSTEPVMTSTRLGVLVVRDDGQIVPKVFDVKYGVDGNDISRAMSNLLTTIGRFRGRALIVNGYSDMGFDTRQDPDICRYTRTPFLGSLTECVLRELRLAIWEAFQSDGLTDSVPLIVVKEVSGGMVVAALGDAGCYAATYQHGPEYRTTCETCVQGLQLMDYGAQWMSDSIVGYREGGVVKFGQFELSDLFVTKIANYRETTEKDATIESCLLRLFTDANAGAMEMAHINQVVISGVY